MTTWPRMTIRPISDRTAFAGRHEPSPFKATWSDTLDLLDRELQALRAKNTVLEVDVRERDIRIDGYPRADAKAASPAVRIAFDSMHGPLVYATDRFCQRGYSDRLEDWQHNVRAIALGLEALRKVDRYGITKRGEQYTGWKALPSGSGAIATHMTPSQALRVLHDAAGTEENEYVEQPTLIRRAKARAHPDRNNGDRTAWDQVELAERVLARAGA